MTTVDRSRLPTRTRRDDPGRSTRAAPRRAEARRTGRSSASQPGARRAGALTARRVDDTETGWRLVALLSFVGAGGLYLYLAVTSPTRGVLGAAALPLLVLAGLAVIQLLVRANAPTYDLAGIAGTGLGLRLVGGYARFLNPVDAFSYHTEGIRLAEAYRVFDFGADPERDIPGTGTIRVASGVLHVVTFDDFLLTLLLFTLGSFVGACLFVRALQIAFPEADQKRYAMLVFLLPTLYFWPSSLGKEAWMMLGLGLFALGAARLYAGTTARAVPEVVLGLAMTTLVRPHVSVLALAALGVGFLGAGTNRTRVRTAARIAGVALLLLGGAVLARSAADRLNLENLGTDELSSAQQRTAESTSTSGGSAFEPVIANGPLSFGVATVTVLFRPLPGEVRSVEGVLASMESVFLVGLGAVSIRRYARLPGLLRRVHYLLLCVAFTLGFVWAFSAIGNFGILTRQRSQVLPFFLVLLALPPLVERQRHRRRARLGPDRRRGDDDAVLEASLGPRRRTVPPAT